MSQAAHRPSAQDLLTRVCAAPRVQPFRFIHKALRALLLQALQCSGALDATDAGERARIVEEVERTLAFCADHLAHENHFLLGPLRQRAPRAVLAFETDHHDQLAAIAVLRLTLQRLRDAADDAPALAYELHLRLSDFVADKLPHMLEEETTLTQALWDQFTDAELDELIAARQAALSPQEAAFCLQWMARGLSVPELASVLGDMRLTTPAPVFDALAGSVRQALDAPRGSRLARLLGLPPVPGLVCC